VESCKCGTAQSPSTSHFCAFQALKLHLVVMFLVIIILCFLILADVERAQLNPAQSEAIKLPFWLEQLGVNIYCNRSCWRSYHWSNAESRIRSRHLGSWCSVGWKVRYLTLSL